MDIMEKLQQSLYEQKELIAKVEGSMSAVPDQQKNNQAVALKLLKDELTLITEAQLSLTVMNTTPSVTYR